MAKYTRTVVGSVLKAKEKGKPDYIKINKDITLSEGQILKLESKASRLADLEDGVSKGRLGADMAEKIKETINKQPDFVRFDMVLLTKNE